MQISVTLSSVAALFGAMFVLALTPSPSVFAVVARAIASGLTHGLITAAGIVVGDYVFILLAVYGLSIASPLSIFAVIKYCGGAYLIWSGIVLCRAKLSPVEVEGIKASWLSSFLSGLAITLSDYKAIVFYISFLPAFVELSSVSPVDIGIVMAVSTVAVGGAKSGYAYLADRASFLLSSDRARKSINIAAGLTMIATGIFLIAKA